MPKGKKIDFEASLDQLEQLVDQMEDGELTLEESLKAFEQGVKLTRECQQALQVFVHHQLLRWHRKASIQYPHKLPIPSMLCSKGKTAGANSGKYFVANFSWRPRIRACRE